MNLDSGVLFPLYVFADDQHMFLVENAERILYHMEPIDIENGEFLLWDANEIGVRISVSGNKVTGVSHTDNELNLADAFRRYSDTYGLNVDTTGPAEEVWRRLKDAEARLPRRPSLFARFFGRSEK